MLALFDEIWILLGLWVVPFIFLGLYRWLAKAIGRKNVNTIVYALLGLILVVFACPIVLSNFRFGSSILSAIGGTNSIFLFMYVLLGIFPASAPLWSMLIMGQTSYHLIKHYETKFSIAHGVGWVIWLGGFVTAWRLAIVKTLEHYAALPPQPPACYIATAAANGHKQIVHSHEVWLEDGKCMHVNEQLRRLKCAELSVLAITPGIHASLRRLYDVLGKWLAARMSNPFIADAAYLLLKPAEWISTLALSLLVPQTKGITDKFYKSSWPNHLLLPMGLVSIKSENYSAQSSERCRNTLCRGRRRKQKTLRHF
jgi:hypothetical protein